MDRSQLRQRARSLSGIRQTEIKSDADVDAMIEEVNLELSGARDWPWLYLDETVAVDAESDEVELPAAVRTFQSLRWRNSDGREVRLHQVPVGEVDRAGVDREGEPYAYARITDRRILLVPTTKDAGSLLVRGYRKPEPLATDTDVPEFDSEFHHIIAYAVAARMLTEEGDDSERAPQYAETVRDIVSAMRERYMQTHEVRGDVIVIGGRADARPRWRVR